MERVNPDVFIAVGAIAWADGKIEPDESDAIVRAAIEAGLSLEEVARVEASIAAKVDIDRAIDRSSMTKEDRLFFYAVATWIARLDGEVTLDESDALASLAAKLGVPDRTRARVEALVDEVARLPDGDRPLRYDLPKLRELVGSRLLAAASP
jgi:uncharacterized membrane protein YebE (DUF533 family)